MALFPVHQSANRSRIPTGSIFVSLDGCLSPPEVVSQRANRFSFRLAGTTGRWNPTRDPPRFIQSGDQVNIYCHSVGLGPYRHVSSPLVEASPVGSLIRVSVAGKTTRMFVPATQDAFISLDRDLIQQYDNSGLSEADTSTFEKIGCVTACKIEIAENLLTMGPIAKDLKSKKIHITQFRTLS